MIESYWILKAFDLYAILFQTSGPAIINWSIADQKLLVARNLWKILSYIIHLFGLLALHIIVCFYVGIHTLLHHFYNTQEPLRIQIRVPIQQSSFIDLSYMRRRIPLTIFRLLYILFLRGWPCRNY